MTDQNGSRGMRLIAGNSNRALAEAIGQHLKIEPVKAQVRRFADMEVFVEIQENVRGEDMFVMQSTSYPANDNLMELLIMIDALRRAAYARGFLANRPLAGTFEIPSAMQTGKRLGMVTMNDTLLALVEQQQVEPKEAYLKFKIDWEFRLQNQTYTEWAAAKRKSITKSTLKQKNTRKLVRALNAMGITGWLDAGGHGHSEDMKVQERFTRTDFGHIDVAVTITDPKVFTRPFTINFVERLLPDTDVFEHFCIEAEKDAAHMK